MVDGYDLSHFSSVLTCKVHGAEQAFQVAVDYRHYQLRLTRAHMAPILS